ncbi:response regulator [Egicoccus sp. AB-alg6-2]|uniref:response regulator n=1 Tax=Egicoccus sp. AB-alg6-2 TaxID=3242692 RepID=UPI00359E44E5
MPERRTATRIVLVDDHQILSDALHDALSAVDGLQVVGTARDLAAGLALVESERPDVVIMDVRLPDGDGAAGTAEALRRHPDTKVLVLSAQAGLDVVARAVEAGAAGFLTKDTPLAELATAVMRVQEGAVLFAPELLRAVTRHLRQSTGRVGDDLSARELEVLTLLTQGASTREMAEQLYLSLHTVRNHVRNLTTKLGARSRLEAVAIANREGLVTDERVHHAE